MKQSNHGEYPNFSKNNNENHHSKLTNFMGENENQQGAIATPNDFSNYSHAFQTSTNKHSSSSGTTFNQKYRYHPYDMNSRSASVMHPIEQPTSNENQYARIVNQSSMQSPSNFSSNIRSSLFDASMLDDNIRNMQNSRQTLLEPSVRVEPHFDSNIFTMRKRNVVTSSSSFSSHEESPTYGSNRGVFSSSSLSSLNSLESPSDSSRITPPFSLQPLSSVTFRNSTTTKEAPPIRPKASQEIPNHPPPTLIPLSDYKKSQEQRPPTDSYNFVPPLVTQNYSLTPLNLLQDSRKFPSSTSLMSSSSSSASIEMADNSPYTEFVNPSSYLRPLKQTFNTAPTPPTTITSNNGNTSSNTPFSDPIILDLSKIPSSFDESAHVNSYPKAKKIKNFVNDGPWTTEEHDRLVLGLQKCGPNWKEISENYVKSRTRVQVHAYATKVLKIKSPNYSDQ